MRTRINNITFTPGTRSITTGITDLTIDDIRLFINESQMKVICSSMQKDNVVSISSGVVTYKDTFPVLAVGDHITFEIDKGDNVAKEATSLEILSYIGDLDEKITPYLYDECSVEDIDHMFTSVTEDGYIIVPPSIIKQDGTIPLKLFVSITGLTPVLNDDERPVEPIIDENGRIVLPASAFSSDGTMSISLFQQLTGLRLV